MAAAHTDTPAAVPPVRVRPYAPEDRDAVIDLAPRLLIGVAGWLDPPAVLDAVHGWVQAAVDAIGPDQAVLVAEDDRGRRVGFVTVARNTHWAGAPQAYVGELVVAEDAEGSGVGRALLAAVAAWARDHGCATVALDTGAANTRARRFYARAGFVEESIKLVQVLR